MPIQKKKTKRRLVWKHESKLIWGLESVTVNYKSPELRRMSCKQSSRPERAILGLGKNWENFHKNGYFEKRAEQFFSVTFLSVLCPSLPDHGQQKKNWTNI